MEIEKALSQISEIHSQLGKTEVYRGYRAVPVALSGALALAAAAGQARFLGNQPAAVAVVLYWTVVAGLGLATAGGGIAWKYMARSDRAARRKTRIAVGQFLPCIAAGVFITAAAAAAGPGAIAFLPGLWAILFSLGVFASRPYLPRLIGFVGLFYLGAGAVLLALAPRQSGLSPWGIGLTFGIGQILAGIVLYWSLERNENR
ncbi:MAG: hypothetical protein NTW86_13915 [Candidatus Sumerlaeota bacterium]|nr:hypothetical protein [Candidatus Sumerlaeota bacterium]